MRSSVSQNSALRHMTCHEHHHHSDTWACERACKCVWLIMETMQLQSNTPFGCSHHSSRITLGPLWYWSLAWHHRRLSTFRAVCTCLWIALPGSRFSCVLSDVNSRIFSCILIYNLIEYFLNYIFADTSLGYIFIPPSSKSACPQGHWRVGVFPSILGHKTDVTKYPSLTENGTCSIITAERWKNKDLFSSDRIKMILLNLPILWVTSQHGNISITVNVFH